MRPSLFLSAIALSLPSLVSSTVLSLPKICVPTYCPKFYLKAIRSSAPGANNHYLQVNDFYGNGDIEASTIVGSTSRENATIFTLELLTGKLYGGSQERLAVQLTRNENNPIFFRIPPDAPPGIWIPVPCKLNLCGLDVLLSCKKEDNDVLSLTQVGRFVSGQDPEILPGYVMYLTTQRALYAPSQFPTSFKAECVL